MNTGKLFATLTLTIACIIAMAPLQAGDAATVGDFVVEIAKTRNLNAADPEVAIESLAAVGVRLPQGLKFASELTEGDVTRLASAIGIRLNTSRPEASFDRSQLARFVTTFGPEIGAIGADPRGNGGNPGRGSGPGNGNGGPPFDPFSKGQGNKKGKAKRPTTETDPS